MVFLPLSWPFVWSPPTQNILESWRRTSLLQFFCCSLFINTHRTHRRALLLFSFNCGNENYFTVYSLYISFLPMPACCWCWLCFNYNASKQVSVSVSVCVCLCNDMQHRLLFISTKAKLILYNNKNNNNKTNNKKN